TAETLLIENQQPSLIFSLLIMSNVLLLGVAIAFLILWRGARKKVFAELAPSEDPPEQKEAALFKQLQQQAKSSNPSAFRECLLAWASTRWQRPLVTLDDVAIVANDPLLTTKLEALDRALYSPDASTTIDLDCLLVQLKTLRKQPMGENLPKGNHLQPLYAGS
ncbi:MAG: hypothetical protein V7699_07605, partial [Porticoccus sp.]